MEVKLRTLRGSSCRVRLTCFRFVVIIRGNVSRLPCPHVKPIGRSRFHFERLKNPFGLPLRSVPMGLCHHHLSGHFADKTHSFSGGHYIITFGSDNTFFRRREDGAGRVCEGVLQAGSRVLCQEPAAAQGQPGCVRPSVFFSKNSVIGFGRKCRFYVNFNRHLRRSLF